MTKKMTPADVARYKSLLLHVLQHLTDDLTTLEAETAQACRRARESSSEDVGEEVLSVEFSFELMERDENTVREVLAALERVDEGRYGRCQKCDHWIRRTRLKAIPHARHCIDCQRTVEAEEATA
ncbi:MAG: TraR/DksA C4-type zinc finger protein [Planctomycetes bacterium]|nr:TraR/DksA C4-type zinc finger protein [Planctomycetota bacterium]